MTSKERHELRYERRKAKREKKRQEALKGCTDYDEVLTLRNLYDSYRKCRKGVSWKYSVKNYNVHCMKYTWMAYKELHGIGKKYRYLGTTDFVTWERGKKRDISAQKLPDRVKVKVACDHSLTPATTRSLIWDNGASRKGMGTAHTRRRLLRELLRAYRKWGTDFYIGLTDGHHYFESLRHDVIEGILEKIPFDQRLMALYRYWLEQDGSDGVGLGLGNQANQNYAAIYLNSVDHAISAKIKYIRHADDVIFIGHTKEDVKEALSEFERLCMKVRITLNQSKTVVVPASKGFTFLKTQYKVRPDGKIKRKQSRKNITLTRRRLRYFKTEEYFTQDYIDCYFLNFAGRMKADKNALKNMARMFFSLYQDTRVIKKGAKYVLGKNS